MHNEGENDLTSQPDSLMQMALAYPPHSPTEMNSARKRTSSLQKPSPSTR